MQNNNHSFSINDSRNEFISVDSQNNLKPAQSSNNITQMMQFFQMMKQNPLFMSMMHSQSAQNVDMSKQENFNNANFRQPSSVNYSNVKNNMNFNQHQTLDQKYLPKRQEIDSRTRRHERGKDVLKNYEASEKRQIQTHRNTNTSANTQENKILESFGESFVSNYQQIPRVNKPRQANSPSQKHQQKPIPKVQNFDDMPIKPMKGNQFDQMEINPVSKYEKRSQVNMPNMNKKNPKLNFENKVEEKPIKSQYIDGLKTSRQYERNQSFANHKHQMINSPRKQDLYSKMQDRPISGCQNRNFDQIVNEQLTKQGIITAYQGDHENSENHNQNRVKPAKTFLRKGTREHLSSGIDKKPINRNPKKKVQKISNNHNHNQSYNNEDANFTNATNFTSGGRDLDRDLTPKNSRPTSQNRVLNNKKREELSVSKPQPKIDTKEKKQFTKSIDVQDSSAHDKSINNSVNLPPKHNRKTTPVKNNKNDMSPKNSRPENPNQNQNQQKSPKFQNKPKINVFQDSDSQNQGSAQFPNKSFQNKKMQIIPGVFLSQQQIEQIVRKNSATLKQQQQKLQKLRGKYNDLCQIIEQQRIELKQQLQNERQQFQNYKATQMTKLKNQRRVMQRQAKSGTHGKDSNKQQLQLLKKQLERQKQESKKKDKNNRLLIEKYKKEAEQLRLRLSISNEPNQNQQSFTKSTQLTKPSKAKQQHKKKVEQEVIADYSKSTVQKREQFDSALSSYANGKETVKALPQYNSLKGNASKKNQKFNYVDEDSKLKKTSKNKFQEQQSQDDKYSQSDSDHQPNFGRGSTKNYNQDTSQYYPASSDLTTLANEELSIKKVTSHLIDKLFRYNKNPEYIAYLNKKLSAGRKIVHSSENTVDGRTTHIYNDDGKQIIFTTGVKKEYFPNGYMIIHFKNGDIKQKLSDGTILYFFNEKQVDQITFPNQTNIYRFENNQIEFHFPDNRIEIRHADGTIKVMSPQ